MRERLLIAGAGGQGTLLIGKLLAGVALKTIPNVTFFPSYGIEVRGGTSSCQVVLSSEEIASPICESFDSMILMNKASLIRFSQLGGDGCLRIVGIPPVESIRLAGAIHIPALQIADKLGSTRVANFVLLGVYLARKPVVPVVDIEEELARMMKDKTPEFFELNLRAFHAGLNAGREQ
ncbi:MAG: 2-oxoacid:acceptor oxidoreductase family protein [Kiritimatiellae bacterium]|nr:2-oxoacid:acceptor oxidoreductase family protein [Kiritimatiellia bacterium]